MMTVESMMGVGKGSMMGIGKGSVMGVGKRGMMGNDGGGGVGRVDYRGGMGNSSRVVFSDYTAAWLYRGDSATIRANNSSSAAGSLEDFSRGNNLGVSASQSGEKGNNGLQ